MELTLRSTGLDGGSERYVIIERSPFKVGRREGCHYKISDPEISGFHAEFRLDAGTWWLRDRGSTNGTYVNGIRITKGTPLKNDDIIHFGSLGFQVTPGVQTHDGNGINRTMQVKDSRKKVEAAIGLYRIINSDLAYSVFQPIVNLETRETMGHEALGRAATEDPIPPGDLFTLVESGDLAVRLSETFRDSARECANCRLCWTDTPRSHLFLNLDPEEILRPDFPDFLECLSREELSRNYRIVLEIPESLVCNTKEMRTWVEHIRRYRMFVAYDDFGKGQSRIADLVNAPPDYLKFDRELVAALGVKSMRSEIVGAIADAARKLGVQIIAEGVENQEELDACQAMGMQFGQGNYLSEPLPAWKLFGADPTQLPESCRFVKFGLLPDAADQTLISGPLPR